jgi:lysophospholipase L1-like esterase
MIKYKIYILLAVLLIPIILYANNSYYEHKVSQFKELSKQSNKNIVMIGDSITDRGLWCELANRNDIINRGISGDTTSGVLNRLNNLNPNLQQAFVMIGINDLLRGQSVEYIFNNYKIIIIKLKVLGIKPIIQSTLYIRTRTNIINQKVKKLNNLLLEYTKKNKIEFIDLNTKLAPNKVLLKKYSLDGLHLNGQGYILWSKILKRYIAP